MSARGLVLVTGAARRVGAVIARKLAGEGWGVALHCHNSRTEADALAATIRADGGRAEIVIADLSDFAAIDSVTATLAHRGDWVGLVNNAASFERDDIADFALERAEAQIRLNLLAPVYLARRLAEALPPTSHGFVTNISDQKVLNPNTDFLSYTLSKIALAQATSTLAMTLAPRIRVNCVLAGLMLPSGDQSEAQFATVHDKVLTGQGTRAEDVADAVAFLASAENITGAVLPVDGGQHLVASDRDVMFT